jgi:hypothetical protein
VAIRHISAIASSIIKVVPPIHWMSFTFFITTALTAGCSGVGG